MCQMHRKDCFCGKNTAELFFGNLVLDEVAVSELYCPDCSGAVDLDNTTVEDNGWVLKLDLDVLKAFSPRMGMEADTVTAEDVFDGNFVTWVGFSPDDNKCRAEEREQVMQDTADDKLAQFTAIKQWALDREKKFVEEGWRKVRRKSVAA